MGTPAPARVVQPRGKRCDAQAGHGLRHLPGGPALRRRDVNGRNHLPHGRGQRGLGPDIRHGRQLGHVAATGQGQRQHGQQRDG
jgi:hypothetical protein